MNREVLLQDGLKSMATWTPAWHWEEGLNNQLHGVLGERR